MTYNYAPFQASNVRIISASGDVTHLATDYAIIIKKTNSESTQVNLISSPSTGYRVLIKDGKGDAATNPTVVSAAGGYTIDGYPNLKINSAFGSIELLFNGSGWNVIGIDTNPFPTAIVESAESTTITLPSQTIYASQTPGTAPPTSGPFDTWTMTASPGQVVHNGVADATTYNVSSLAYHNHTVYYEDTSFNWYVYASSVSNSTKNLITNSSNVGASAGTPGILPTNWSATLNGLSQQVVGSGNDPSNHLPYIDIRFFGTPSSGTTSYLFFDTLTNVPVSPSTTYTLSSVVTPVAGSNANISAVSYHLDEWTSSQGYVTTTNGFIGFPSTTTTTYSKTVTTQPTTGYLQSSLVIGYTVGSPVDVTYRISGVQLEAGSAVTTFAPTPASATHWSYTNSPISTAKAISISTVGNQSQNAAFTLSGALAGYSSPPSLSYQDSTGSLTPFPSGATITSTSWSFVHPAIASVSAGMTVSVEDTNTPSVNATSNSFKVSAPTPTLTGITLSNNTFTPSSSGGVFVGTISVQSTATFTGTLSLSGTDAGSFAINGSNLVTSGATTARTYSIVIVATQTGANGSPLSSSTLTITGSSSVAVVHYGSSAPSSIPNVTGNVSPLGWTVGHFEDFLSFNPNLTNLNSYTPVGASNENPSKYWELGIGNGTFHLNGSSEQEYYCSTGLNGINPFSHSGSVLTITASVPTSGQVGSLNGYQYISGALCSRQFLTSATGYFECNMKFPVGSGMWGAFWLSASQTWPPEFDVIEQFGSAPTKMYSTAHYGTNGAYRYGIAPTVSDITAGFHTYGGLMTPNYIAWYFDGALVGSSSAPIGSAANYFNTSTPMQVIINLALGTGMGDTAVTNSELPASLQIDWFRYSQLGPA